MPIRIVFETRSTTEDNENGVATGWLPGKLSRIGREQAAELGRRRAHDDIAAIFCSDLARATQTAAIAHRPALSRWRELAAGYSAGTKFRDRLAAPLVRSAGARDRPCRDSMGS